MLMYKGTLKCNNNFNAIAPSVIKINQMYIAHFNSVREHLPNFFVIFSFFHFSCDAIHFAKRISLVKLNLVKYKMLSGSVTFALVKLFSIMSFFWSNKRYFGQINGL